MKRILITGASGFIGSFIVEEALRQGMETWAAVRSSSSRAYLNDQRINFIELDLSDEQRLTEQLRALRMPIERFVFLSSLSVMGAIREQQPYTEIREDDTPQPNTAYGKSKLEAEETLKARSEEQFPYVILRPTGVYGPREKDYFIMAKSIKGHSDFAVGYKPQDITFVYVKDVVQAVFLALDHGKTGRTYFLSDGKVYRSATFSNLIRRELGNPWWIRITAPIWILRIVTAVGDIIGRLSGKAIALNNDKYHILRQRNWRCDIQPAIDELGYKPQYDLERGVRETIAWYKKEGWI